MASSNIILGFDVEYALTTHVDASMGEDGKKLTVPARGLTIHYGEFSGGKNGRARIPKPSKIISLLHRSDSDRVDIEVISPGTRAKAHYSSSTHPYLALINNFDTRANARRETVVAKCHEQGLPDEALEYIELTPAEEDEVSFNHPYDFSCLNMFV